MRSRHTGASNSKLILFFLLILAIILIKVASNMVTKTLEERATGTEPAESQAVSP